MQLASSPEEVTKCARQKASQYISEACQLFTELDPHDPAYRPLEGLLAKADEEFNLGNLDAQASNIELSQWAKATRAYTRAQARALEVIQALHPAPEKPEDFGA